MKTFQRKIKARKITESKISSKMASLELNKRWKTSMLMSKRKWIYSMLNSKKYMMMNSKRPEIPSMKCNMGTKRKLRSKLRKTWTC